ncbi:MAG: hypothetical protein WA941_15045 [Nitrososphaeraceae archaeon]
MSSVQSLYHAELDLPISRDNPFTNTQDAITELSDLLLWNGSPDDIAFSNDDYITITLIIE